MTRRPALLLMPLLLVDSWATAAPAARAPVRQAVATLDTPHARHETAFLALRPTRPIQPVGIIAGHWEGQVASLDVLNLMAQQSACLDLGCNSRGPAQLRPVTHHHPGLDFRDVLDDTEHVAELVNVFGGRGFSFTARVEF